MKAYIINLKKSVQRREHATKEAEKQRLDYEFIDAVDGSQLSEAEIAEFCDLEAISALGDWFNRGSIGCALSHYKAYQKIIADEVDAGLILEDDTVLPENLGGLLDGIEQNLRASEVVMLHYMSFIPLRLSTSGAVSLLNNRQLLYPCSLKGVNSGAAYVITKQAAKDYLAAVLPIRLAIDEWAKFYDNAVLKSIRFVYPMPITVAGAKSTIAATSQSSGRARFTEFVDNYKIPPFYQILRGARLQSIKSRSIVEVVDEPTPFQASV